MLLDQRNFDKQSKRRADFSFALNATDASEGRHDRPLGKPYASRLLPACKGG